MSPPDPAHPTQPVVLDEDGRARCKVNAVVRHLYNFTKTRGLNLNDIAELPFTKEDMTQFMQLLGYTVDGLAELSFVETNIVRKLDAEAAKLRSRRKSAAAR